MKIYDKMDELPWGRASDTITEGCIVLEGGAWRGLYTLGVIDRMMENDINLRHTIGVSAGALCGMNYVSGQIGRAVRINLGHRHDREYLGLGALRRDHGITGFSYLFNELSEEYPFDEDRFFDPSRSFTAVCTNVDTGRAEYFNKEDAENIYAAVQASATVPYVSEPVTIGNSRYLDGGLENKIPLEYALNQGHEKILLVRTRDRDYRKHVRAPLRITRVEYRRYPNLKRDLEEEAARYNVLIDRMTALEQQGQIFMIAPSKPIDIKRFEGNVEALADIYYLGYEDAGNCLDALKEYLEK